MADEHAASEQVPVVGPPAESIDERTQKKGWIGHAPGDHHVRAATERLDDALRPQIGVRRHDTVPPDVADPAHAGQQGRILTEREIEHVVPGQRSDLQAPQSEVPGDLDHAAGGGDRVGRAHIADDPYALAVTARQHRPHPRLQQRVVAPRGVLTLGLLSQGDGAFGQAFEDEVVEAATLDQLDRRLDPVAREPGPGADADRLHRGSTPKIAAANAMTSEAHKR